MTSNKLGYWIIGAAAAAVVSVAPAVNASPAGVAAGVKQAAQESSPVQAAAYRDCWWRKGVRHCRWRGRGPVYGYSADLPPDPRLRPEAYPTGSTAWWRAMDRDGRGGQRR